MIEGYHRAKAVVERFMQSLRRGAPLTAISFLAVVECLLSAFKQVDDRLHDIRVINGAVVGYFSSAVTHGVQHDDLLGVTSHDDVRIVGADDDLTFLFELGKDAREHISNEPLVEIVFRLVNEQRSVLVVRQRDQRQHGT